MRVVSLQLLLISCVLCAITWGLATTWPVTVLAAEIPDAAPTFGPKHLIVQQVKGVVGPSVQIDARGLISAAWVEEEKEPGTILFA